jgi:hypothetical protein
MGDTPDPALVRPYVKAASGGVAEQERGPGEEETWPEAASLPADTTPADDDTVVQPVVPAVAPRSHPLGWKPRVLILCGGVALALTVVGYFLLGSGAPDERQPSVALPAVTAGVPAGPTTAGSPRPSASADRSGSPSASPSASTASTQPSQGPSATPPRSAPVSPTLTPPAADRTGAITAASGRCLALGGLFGSDGSPIQAAGCMDVSAQQFTLATDGTLRVSGKCAQATGDASVRVAGCGEQSTGQWRGGPGGTLVNSANGQCLTDPGWAGATVKVSACGGADQSWTLP